LPDRWRFGQDGDVVEIELSERWASPAEPLRELMAEVEREAHADRTTPPGSRCCVGTLGTSERRDSRDRACTDR
jgi:hypothetical protein